MHITYFVSTLFLIYKVEIFKIYWVRNFAEILKVLPLFLSGKVLTIIKLTPGAMRKFGHSCFSSDLLNDNKIFQTGIWNFWHFLIKRLYDDKIRFISYKLKQRRKEVYVFLMPWIIFVWDKLKMESYFSDDYRFNQNKPSEA